MTTSNVSPTPIHAPSLRWSWRSPTRPVKPWLARWAASSCCPARATPSSPSWSASTSARWALAVLRLVRWARGQKVERLYGDVFDQNTPMLTLCESLGFTRQQDHDTPGLFRIMLDLREQHPDDDTEDTPA